MCLQECPVQLSDTETTALRRQSLSAQSAPGRLGGSEYAELSRLVRDAGLLHRRTRYYTWKIVATVAALAAGWAASVVADDSWRTQLTAPRGMVRLIRRYQAYLFFPMLTLEAVNLHVASVRALAGRTSRHRPAEAALLAAHVAGYLALVLAVLGPGLKAVAFVLVQQGLFGLYLGCSFAPNHKGMPVLTASDRSDFLRRQVLTSRNIRGGWLTDMALGGLNYQIEHHLFPSAPRPSLRRCQPLIREFCEQRGLPYCQTSLTGSFAAVLGHLNSVGRPGNAGRLAPSTAP